MLPTLLGRPPNLVALSVALLFLLAARAVSGQPLERVAPIPAATISGTILDPTGVAMAGAEVTLAATEGAPLQTSSSEGDGRFSFVSVSPGSYVVVVHVPGFERFATTPFTVVAQQTLALPPIRLAIAGLSATVVVRPTEVIAEEQIKAQEKQRMLGVVPNFYVSYVPDAAPMTSRQKGSLALHQSFDWTAFPRVTIAAGLQHATKTYAGFGGGASGYAKRWAATFVHERSGDLLTHYVFASVFRQDPRYFYQGTGSRRSRLVHALSSALVARSDSGRTVPNYASLFGNLTAGALTDLYYPRRDRGIGLVLTNAAIGVAGRAALGVFQEFVAKRVTTNVPESHSSKPAAGDPHSARPERPKQP